MHELVRSINTACEPSLDDGRLEKAFEKWWPDLDAKLQFIEDSTPAPAGDTRSDRQLLEEMLDLVRGLARTTSEPILWADRIRGKWQPAVVTRVIYTEPATSETMGAAWDEVVRRLDGMPGEATGGDEQPGGSGANE